MPLRRHTPHSRRIALGPKTILFLWFCLFLARPDSAWADSLSNVNVYVNDNIGLMIEVPNGSGANAGGTVSYNSNVAANGTGIGSSVNIFPGAGTTYTSPMAPGLNAATVKISSAAPQYGSSYNGEVFTASATATGSLATGSVTTSSSAGLPCIANQCDYGLNSMAGGQIFDTLTFHIAGAGNSTVTNIGVQFSIQGSSNPAVPTQPGVLSSWAAMTGSLVLGSGGITYNFDTTEGYPAAGRVLQNGGWASNNIVSQTPQNFIFNGTYALTGNTVIVPVRISLQCSTRGGSCSYTDTAAIGLNLPPNVTFTSDSGVFLTGSAQPPAIPAGGVVTLNGTANTIQPGAWFSIFGANLISGSVPQVWSGNYPTTLGGTSVTIDNKPAYLWYVSPTQINLQAPDDATRGVVNVTVTTPNGTAASTVTLADQSPGWSLLGDGKHVAGIIVRPDGSGAYGSGSGSYDIIGPTGTSLGYKTVAATAGDTIVLFGVGFGPTSPAIPAGQAYSGPAANAADTVAVSINGHPVIPFFIGAAFPGLFQFNMTLPSGLGTGDQPLSAVVNNVSTPTGVVIALQ